MNNKSTPFRIGIASRADEGAHACSPSRADEGAHKPAAGEPKVWFTAMEPLAQILSTKNTLLLELIRRARPASLKELAELSGRAVSKLSRTLRTMERYRLVTLTETDRGTLVPTVPYDRLMLERELG